MSREVISTRRVKKSGIDLPRKTKKRIRDVPSTPRAQAVSSSVNNQHTPLNRDNPIASTLWRGPQLRAARNGTRLHVSDLIGKCMRMKALSHLRKVPLPAQQLWDAQRITFDIGETIGNFVVNKAMENDGRIFGSWGCHCAEQKTTANCTRAEALDSPACPDCGHKYDRYLEVDLYHEELMLAGHADLGMMWDEYVYLTEVKSANANTMQDYENRPNREHVLQLIFYYWLALQQGIRVHTTGSVLYVRKEWMIGSPYVEHQINLEEEVHLLEPYLEEARQYTEAMKGGALPTRTVCDTPYETRATKCMLCMECFKD